MRTMTISLSQQQASRIKKAVDTGAYASNSEVLRDALRLWEQREDLRALELARLKKAYDAGLASGDAREISAEDLLKEFRKKASARG
ncbi:MAG: type II toxin-antitoxin system ParD family antitoxin [Methylocystis sp.]|nr:type II toxin-antitoxin system ParD family antitoxin [Methylocystis sp.]